MAMTRSALLSRLQEAITADEWTALAEDKLVISDFNRGIMYELRDARTDEQEIPEENVENLRRVIADHLGKYLADKPEGWKWIILSCLYLTFIAGRPMHDVEFMDIKVTTEGAKTVYECPNKLNDKETTCYYCVCDRMSNYEIMKRRMEKEFLNYDQEKMIRKFDLRCDSEYLYINFFGRPYRIGRKTGKVQWSENDFADCCEADYNEAMTIYDVLGYSRDDCHLAGEFINVKSLSSVQGASLSPGSTGKGMFYQAEEAFDNRDEDLSRACEKLKGVKIDKGDVGYQLPMFDFLPVILQFWDSDEDFPPSLQLFTDKNMLDYMHFETVWFAISHMTQRLREEMDK